jgi:SNF2 family DNA or RNA helicase
VTDDDLMPYQTEGVNRILGSDCMYIADDPGLGKTAQVIRACANMTKAILDRGVVIVCPASLRSNWAQEWGKWEGPACEKHIMSYQEAVKDCEGNPPKKGSKRVGLLSKTWGVVVFDEAHALKTSGGKTNRAKCGLIFNVWKIKGEDEETPDRWERRLGISSTKTIMLSGTPILNKPIDIFPVLRHMRPKVWSSKSKFESRYCDAHVDRYGRWKADGHSNLKELKERLDNSGIFIRRRKRDVLKQLPPKRRQIITVDATAKTINLVEAELKAKMLSDSTADMDWEVKAFEEFENMSTDHVAQIRRTLGLAKVDPCMNYLVEQEKLGVLPEKLVLFAHHREVIERAVDALCFNNIRAAPFYGGMNDRQKNDVVEDFQKGDLRVFVGSIMAAGVGLTLTAADTCMILEPSYVPAENVQAEDRLHRIGAVNPVLVQYIALANTLDVRILDLVTQKMRMIDELFG